MKRLIVIMVILVILLSCSKLAMCQEKMVIEKQSLTKATPLQALARMPVKEITVFKDGHAFVLHEGRMPTDVAGNVVMDYLPRPVIGTFWPYCSDTSAKLTAVVAGRRRVIVERTALNIYELLEANVGARVSIRESRGFNYTATILGIPLRSSQELRTTNPPNSEPALPLKGNVILLKTEEGTRVVPLSYIQELTFIDKFKTVASDEEFRNTLTLKLHWRRRKPSKNARVGLVYLQKGVRWIPSYKITIDGKGNAVVKLQATLINELTDLEDVTANLVIGVPTFAFKDTPDPIALQQAVAQLSRYFQPGAMAAHAFSNAIMTQTARMGEYRAPVRPARTTAAPARPADLGPEIPGSTKSDDLFVFTVKHITLKKGERMVLPVVEFTIKYKDIYTLEFPLTPPLDVRKSFNNSRSAQLARLLRAPKAMHKIRLFNESSYPLTTAPALILREGRILAQGMMTYTAVGASSDLEITTAVDIRVKKSETETKRTPKAARWYKYDYARVDLAGTITLTNYCSQPAEMEVVCHSLGNLEKADNNGVVEQLNASEHYGYPAWWGWYNWPSWWNHFNGIGRFTWKLKLEPGKSVNLGYTWHYYWR